MPANMYKDLIDGLDLFDTPKTVDLDTNLLLVPCYRQVNKSQ